MTMYSSRRPVYQTWHVFRYFRDDRALARCPIARSAFRGPSPLDWMSPDGKARYRWDALRKVTGQKTFARDFRARDLSGWPKEQAHAFFIKATRADRIFEGRGLEPSGAEMQPDRLVLHEELFGDGVTVPQPESLAAGFYGKTFWFPKGRRRL